MFLASLPNTFGISRCAFYGCERTLLRKLYCMYITADIVNTLPTAKILSAKNARAWVSMVLYLKK